MAFEDHDRAIRPMQRVQGRDAQNLKIRVEHLHEAKEAFRAAPFSRPWDGLRALPVQGEVGRDEVRKFSGRELAKGSVEGVEEVLHRSWSLANPGKRFRSCSAWPLSVRSECPLNRYKLRVRVERPVRAHLVPYLRMNRFTDSSMMAARCLSET